MSDFPKMLYRDGTEIQVWDRFDVDTCIVGDAIEEDEALSAGWRLTPNKLNDADADGSTGGSVDGWDQQSDDALLDAVKLLGVIVHHKTGRAKLLQILRERKAA